MVAEAPSAPTSIGFTEKKLNIAYSESGKIFVVYNKAFVNLVLTHTNHNMQFNGILSSPVSQVIIGKNDLVYLQREDGQITIVNFDMKTSLLHGIIFNLDTT